MLCILISMLFFFSAHICLYGERYSISIEILRRPGATNQPQSRVMKTSVQFNPFTAMRRLGAAMLFSAAMAVSVAGAHADPLVTPQWLNDHLADSVLVVLDIRPAIDGGGAQAYAAGHIPKSVHSDYDKAGWRVTRNNVPFMVPTVPELEKLIGDLGIDEETHVVVVPAGVNVLDFGSAARTYWTLKYVGVKNVSILDGG